MRTELHPAQEVCQAAHRSFAVGRLEPASARETQAARPAAYTPPHGRCNRPAALRGPKTKATVPLIQGDSRLCFRASYAAMAYQPSAAAVHSRAATKQARPIRESTIGPPRVQ